MSNSTRSPSASVLKPWPWIAEWCTKQSFWPPSGVMNPKPLASLNHFTVPVVRGMFLPLDDVVLCSVQVRGCRTYRHNLLFVINDPHDGLRHSADGQASNEKKDPCVTPGPLLA